MWNIQLCFGMITAISSGVMNDSCGELLFFWWILAISPQSRTPWGRERPRTSIRKLPRQLLSAVAVVTTSSGLTIICGSSRYFVHFQQLASVLFSMPAARLGVGPPPAKLALGPIGCFFAFNFCFPPLKPAKRVFGFRSRVEFRHTGCFLPWYTLRVSFRVFGFWGLGILAAGNVSKYWDSRRAKQAAHFRNSGTRCARRNSEPLVCRTAM